MARVQESWPTAKYRLTEKAYISRQPGGDPVIIDPAQGDDPHVVYAGKPGPHMEATCEEGRAAKERVGDQVLDPTRRLSLVLGHDADIDEELEELNARRAALMSRRREIAEAQRPAAPIQTAPPPAAPPPPPPPAPPPPPSKKA